MLPCTKVSESAFGRLLSFPVDRSSRTVTRWERSSSSSTRCPPIKPAPPVTKTFIGGFYSVIQSRVNHNYMQRFVLVEAKYTSLLTQYTQRSMPVEFYYYAAGTKGRLLFRLKLWCYYSQSRKMGEPSVEWWPSLT